MMLNKKVEGKMRIKECYVSDRYEDNQIKY